MQGQEQPCLLITQRTDKSGSSDAILACNQFWAPFALQKGPIRLKRKRCLERAVCTAAGDQSSASPFQSTPRQKSHRFPVSLLRSPYFPSLPLEDKAWWPSATRETNADSYKWSRKRRWISRDDKKQRNTVWSACKLYRS